MHYRQSAFELDPLLKRCLSIAGAAGLVFLIAVFLAPRRPVVITSVDQVPERFAKLILEEKPKPPPVAVKAQPKEVAQAEAKPEEAPEPKEEKAPPKPERPRARSQAPQVAQSTGQVGRARAETEVTKQLEDVTSSLSSVIADLSTTLSAGGGAADVPASRKPRKGAVRSGRSGAEVGAVNADPAAGGAVSAGSSQVSGTLLDIGAITRTGSSGGSADGGSGGRAGGRRGGTGSVAGSELRTDASLLAVVRKYSAGIRFCYDTELKKDPSLRGKLIVAITVAASGAVTETRVVQDTLGSDALTSCALAQMRSWKFPQIPEGVVTFQAPFVFTPPEN
jgi:TonB family protein